MPAALLCLSCLGLYAQLSTGPALTPAKPKVRPRRAVSATPMPTTVDALLAGKHAVGRAVVFPGVLLPGTAIQATNAGETTYFALAVKKDALYLQAVGARVTALRERGLEAARQARHETANDKRFRELIKEADDLVQAALDEKVLPTEAIAVEVPGLAAFSSAFDWETVVEKGGPRRLDFTPRPLPTPPPRSLLRPSASSVRRTLINQAVARPPDLSQTLPDFETPSQFTTTRQLDEFNAVVEIYNAELDRRRHYMVQRTEEDALLVLERLERLLSQPEQPLAVNVIAAPALPRETLARIHGSPPAVFARERAKPQASLARNYFVTTTLQVCSYPSGASVSLDGQEKGVTPYMARDLPTGKAVVVAVAKPGFAGRTSTETVAARASGVRRVDVTLNAEDGASERLLSAEDATRLFGESFAPAKRFRVHVSTPTEPPSFKGKKDKAAIKRVEEVRKALLLPAYSKWLEASDADRADALVEITGLEANARPKDDPAADHAVRTVLRGSPERTEVVAASLKAPKVAADRVLDVLIEKVKIYRWSEALGEP
jgi:hypothetical protein